VAARSTPLLGFKPPFVKDGEVVLPVLTGTGEWHELIATPATWQRAGNALAHVINTPVPAAATSPRDPGLKPGTRRIL
jgi:hypothetical protein